MINFIINFGIVYEEAGNAKEIIDPDIRAGDGSEGRALRRRLWADPGAGHRHVRVLRAVLAAAGLAGGASRAQGADGGLLLRHRLRRSRRP